MYYVNDYYNKIVGWFFLVIVESMKAIAPYKGFTGYLAVLISYISEGLRWDETHFVFSKNVKLIAALKKRGVTRQHYWRSCTWDGLETFPITAVQKFNFLSLPKVKYRP